MTIFELLSKTAALYPESWAITHHDRRITYGELLKRTESLGAYLASLSLPAGSRIGILIENSIEYVTAFFAVFAAGYVVVPLDTSLDADSLGFVLGDCDTQALFVGGRFRKILPDILGASGSVKHLIGEKQIPNAPENVNVTLMSEIGRENPVAFKPRLENVAEDDLAAVFYTSGSTGKPKGVMLSHRNLVSNTLATVEYLKLTPEDSIMVILPFYYIYGNSLLLTHVAVGGRTVIDNRFLYPEVVLDTMEAEKVTGFSGVPSNFMILLGNSTLRKRKLPALRYFTQAGGAMAPETTRQLMAAFPEKEIYIMYGQTEAAPRVTYLPPERLQEKLGSIGIPVPGVEVTIAGEDGQELPTDEVGEIVVSGPNVMLGYWNHTAEESEVLKDGRLFTGDLARKDADGFIYVVGRKKEIIKSGGNRVSVKEVEECILEYDKVLEVAVFGVEDPILGEAIKAVVVSRDGQIIDGGDLKDHCRRRLAVHKVPKHIEFADRLPKQKSGKIDKMKLKARK